MPGQLLSLDKTPAKPLRIWRFFALAGSGYDKVGSLGQTEL